MSNSAPNNATNRPTECTNCYLIAMAYNDLRVFQMIFPGNVDAIFFRSTVTDSSVWYPWKKLAIK